MGVAEITDGGDSRKFISRNTSPDNIVKNGKRQEGDTADLKNEEDLKKCVEIDSRSPHRSRSDCRVGL